MNNVFQNSTRCSGEYIEYLDSGGILKTKFDEGYILNLNSPITYDDGRKQVLAYAIALPNGDTKVALVGDIKINMLGVGKITG